MDEADPHCNELGIPQHLHAGSRSPENDFLPGEVLYRRYDPAANGEDPPAAAFSTRRMSVNRSQYSSEPHDVLYDGRTGRRYSDWSIAEIPVNSLTQEEWKHPDNANRYQLKVVHRPERCMYPHSEIVVLEDGEEVEKVKPPSVKLQIRLYLKENARRIK